ncbi:MAG: family 78 glycoside hydrolase catalytic domain [Planctomycetota bacterium]
MNPTRHKAISLRCEHLENPLGLDETRPRLSWRIADERPGARQTAWQVVAAGSPESLAQSPHLWDSGRVRGDQCLDIIYAGRALKSRQRVFWRVRVWDREGAVSDWSETACFEMGLLKSADWSARWIGRPLEGREGGQPCPHLRRGFALKPGIARARIYASARGLFELHLNGERVGRDYFTPGWTDYHRRIQYLVYDVTDRVRPGANAVGAILGDGWYAGYLAWGKRRGLYGDQLSLLFQLEVEYADGARETIAGGPEWKTSFGPILKSDIYNGETVDARREMPGWAAPGFDDSSWAPAVVFEPPKKAARVALSGRPVRRQEEIPVRARTEPRFGVHVFDLGQNMVGWVRLKVRGKAGQTVTLRHAEMLNPDGMLYTANLRGAACTDVYVCRGGVEEVFEPRFTFHGFRYVEVTGLCEKPSPSDVTGVVLHSEIPETGKFECSDSLVNRLQRNIVWGQKGNFLEVPTDCPQRDERLGWTGDAQVFIPTACFNRDVAAFFTKWCVDLEDSQYADGAFPHVAPDILRDGGRGCAAWADAGVICPWTIHRVYGDRRILERHFDSMKRWVEWRRKNSRGLVCREACFGDWLAIDIAEGNPGRSPTPRDLIATAYFARTADIVAKAAAIIGRRADARKYAALARRVRAAFNREFVSPNGRVAGDTQTGYLLALGFDLLPPKKRAYAVARLVGDIESRKWHLSTGFVGTPLLAPVLTRFGRTDVAYKLLMQKTYPSWFYPILEGDATTMWERWNSYTKKGGFGDVGMNSFNHYAYGAIGEWLYETVAGIGPDPDDPGYRHVIFHPRPGGGLTWAKGEILTRYGRAACAWNVEKNRLVVNVVVPPNTRATVVLPGRRPCRVGAGAHEFTARWVPA